MKYEFVCLYGDEGSVTCGVNEFNFDNITELDNEQLGIIGGFCWLSGESYLDDEKVMNEYNEGNLFEKVNDIIDKMDDENGVWFKGDGVNDIEFREKYGEKVGVRFRIEYDDNCGVLVKGEWFVLREEVKKEMKKRWEDSCV